MKVKPLLGPGILFVALTASGLTLVPEVSASKEAEQRTLIKQLAATNGIFLKKFDSENPIFEKVEQKTYFSSTIAYEAEADVDGTVNRVTDTDRVRGYFNQDGTYHVISSGQDRSVSIDMRLIGESVQCKAYLYSQRVIEGGKESYLDQMITVPKSDTGQIASADITQLRDGGRTLVNLASAEPPDSIPVLDDVRESDTRYGALIVDVIAAALGLGRTRYSP